MSNDRPTPPGIPPDAIVIAVDKAGNITIDGEAVAAGQVSEWMRRKTLVDRLRQLLGPNGILTDLVDTDPYCEDWRRLYHGKTPAVLRPANTAEVAGAVRLCAEYRAPIVPMGGNTSMVGGAAVSEDGSQIILSLSRMNRVREIDPVDMTMEIEAGVTLKAAQIAAEETDCL